MSLVISLVNTVKVLPNCYVPPQGKYLFSTLAVRFYCQFLPYQTEIVCKDFWKLKPISQSIDIIISCAKRVYYQSLFANYDQDMKKTWRSLNTVPNCKPPVDHTEKIQHEGNLITYPGHMSNILRLFLLIWALNSKEYSWCKLSHFRPFFGIFCL